LSYKIKIEKLQGVCKVVSERVGNKDFSWRFWFTLPIYPFGKRRTIRTEVVKDTIWTFDQLQGVFYVIVPIRMTAVKLSEGGLLIYAPVAPTPECIRLLKELVEEHGDVKYIILPTISGLEHKIFVGPFARSFPKAQVFVAPNQWSFPLNLPLSWLGLPPKRTHVLPQQSSLTPFATEFDYAILGPIELGPGRFEEVAFFHKPSRTLLVTDSVVSIPEEPPAIIQIDTYPLLFHARDKAAEIITDSVENRRKGWQRIALFSMYFRPSVLELPAWSEVFRDAFKAKERSRKAYFGLYPFKWRQDWQGSFEALRGDGQLFVAPILQALILNRAPKETIDWADTVASWEFEQVIPCHLDAPVTANGYQFRQAFRFLEQRLDGCALPEVDFQLLREIDSGLNKLGIVPPAKEKV
jgi:Domain of unknown function (DUF4336)